MANYTITTTDTEELILASVMGDPQEWLTNLIQEKARVKGDSIIANLVTHCNDNEIALAVGRSAQITQAQELGLISAAATLRVPVEE